MLGVMASLAHQIDLLDCELRRLAKCDRAAQGAAADLRDRADPACTILAEIGDAKRFRRARQVVRAAGLDPVVKDSADKQRRGQLAKQGAPCLRWALVEAAQHACRHTSPDHELYRRQRGHAGANPATLSVARKIAKRAFHVLRALETQASLIAPMTEGTPTSRRTAAAARSVSTGDHQITPIGNEPPHRQPRSPPAPHRERRYRYGPTRELTTMQGAAACEGAPLHIGLRRTGSSRAAIRSTRRGGCVRKLSPYDT